METRFQKNPTTNRKQKTKKLTWAYQFQKAAMQVILEKQAR
jgi:hypothetical protein